MSQLSLLHFILLFLSSSVWSRSNSPPTRTALVLVSIACAVLVNDQPDYDYEPLAADDGSFRLLELELADRVDDSIKAKLRNANLNNKLDRFAALSYMWGTPGDRVTITLDRKDFFVQANLSRFLRQIRRFGYSNIWVDAICVDPNNISEREQQVGLTQRIYPQAKHVLAYLGEAADDGDRAFEYLSAYMESIIRPCLERRRMAYHCFFAQGDGFPLRKALKKLCHRPYWTRIWIIQELLLPEAGNITLFCGSMRVELRALDAFGAHIEAERTFFRAHHRLRRMRSRGIKWPGVYKSMSYELLRSVRIDQKRGCMRNICSWVSHFRESRCQDVRDRVYGLLGLMAAKSSDLPRKASSIAVNYNQSAFGLLIDIICYDGHNGSEFCFGRVDHLRENFQLVEHMEGTLEVSRSDEHLVALVGLGPRAYEASSPPVDEHAQITYMADLAKLRNAHKQHVKLELSPFYCRIAYIERQSDCYEYHVSMPERRDCYVTRAEPRVGDLAFRIPCTRIDLLYRARSSPRSHTVFETNGTAQTDSGLPSGCLLDWVGYGVLMCEHYMDSNLLQLITRPEHANHHVSDKLFSHVPKVLRMPGEYQGKSPQAVIKILASDLIYLLCGREGISRREEVRMAHALACEERCHSLLGGALESVSTTA